MRNSGYLKKDNLLLAAFYFTIQINTELIIERTKANSIACQKFGTLNPSTILLAKRINKPLMTKVNSPSVITLIGRVKIMTIGFIKILIPDSTKATISAVVRF